MPQEVEVGDEVLEFPDEMSQDDIRGALQKRYAPPPKATLPSIAEDGGFMPMTPEGVQPGGAGSFNLDLAAMRRRNTRLDVAEDTARLASEVDQIKARQPLDWDMGPTGENFPHPAHRAPTTPGEVTALDVLTDPWTAAMRAGQRGTGAALKSLSDLASSIQPGVISDIEANAQTQASYDKRAAMTPDQRRQFDAQNPFYVAGQALQDVAGEAHPVADPNSTGSKIGEAIGGFFPAVAGGPAAPFIFALQAAGETADSAYEEALARGKTPDEAAESASKKALAEGLFQGALMKFYPGQASKLGEAGMKELFGDQIKRQLLDRAARIGARQTLQAAEGAGFGALSRIGSNVIQGHPATEGVGESALGMGLIQGLTPHGAGRGEIERHNAEMDRQVTEMARATEADAKGGDVLQPQHQDQLADAAEQENRSITYKSLNDGEVARPDGKGGVVVDRLELAHALAQIKDPKDQQELIKRIVNEEAIHNETTDDQARKYFDNSSAVERRLAHERYYGNSEAGQTAIRNSESYKTNLGHEMIRAQVQKMDGLSPTEIAYKTGMNIQAINGMENAVLGIRKAWNKLKYSEGGPLAEQYKVLGEVLDKLQKAREIKAENPEARENEPFSRRPAVTEKDVAEMSPEDQPKKLNHTSGIEYGLTLSKDDVPRLEQAYHQATQEMAAAFKGDYDPSKEAEHMAAFARHNFFGGALQGATKGEHVAAGGNYAEYARRNGLDQPASRRPGESRADRIRREAEELRLRKLEAAGVELTPEQKAGMGMKGGTVEQPAPVAPEERVSTNFPRLTAKAMEDAANEEISKSAKATGQSFTFPDKNNPEERVSGVRVHSDRPSFDRFARAMRGVTTDVKPEQLQDIWADRVWGHLLHASGERLAELRKAFGLEGKYGRRPVSEEALGRRDIAGPEAEPAVTDEQAIRQKAILNKRLEKLENEAKDKLKEADELERNAPEMEKKEGELFGSTDRAQGLRHQAFELRYKAAVLRRSLESAEPTSPTLKRKADVRSMAQGGLEGIAKDKLKLNAPLRPAERAGSMGLSQIAYRQKVVRAIAHQMIGEAYKLNERRANLDRPEIGIEDVDFTNKKTKVGSYYEITPGDLEIAKDSHGDRPDITPPLLEKILRDQSRGRSGDPESASRRVVVAVGPDNKVQVLSTYNDAGRQMVTDPDVRVASRPYRPLNASFLRNYHPIATLLLKDPVKGLRQEFDTVSEFRNHIGKEASERSQVGDELLEGLHPEQHDIEGTRGLEGELGSYQGPKRGDMADEQRHPALQSKRPLSRGEAFAVSKYETTQDAREDIEALQKKVKDGEDLSPQDMVKINAMRKISSKIEAGRKMNPEISSDPELADQQVIDRLAAALVQAGHDPNPTRALVRDFGLNLPKFEERQSATTRELEMRGDIKPPTKNDLFAGPFQTREAPSGELGGNRHYIPEGVETPEHPEQRAARLGKARDITLRTYAKKGVILTFDQAAKLAGMSKEDIQTAKELGYAPTKESDTARIARAKKMQAGIEASTGIKLSFENAAHISDLKEGPASRRPGAPSAVKEALDTFKEFAKSPALPAPQDLMLDVDRAVPRFTPNVDSQLTKAMGIERIPLIGRLWGPRGKVRDDVDRAIIGYAVKRSIGNSQAALIGSRMNALVEELGNPFKQDENGVVTNVKGDESQSRHISDLFEDWQRQVVIPEQMRAMKNVDYAGRERRMFPDNEIQKYEEKNPQKMELTPSQDKLFRAFHEVVRDAYEYLGEKNAKLEELKSDKGKQHLMAGLMEGVEVYPLSRVALHKLDTPQAKRFLNEFSRRIGGEYKIESERLYDTEREGAQTTAYEPDMVKRLVAFVQRTYKAVADADMANNPVFKGEEPTERAVKLGNEYRDDLISGKMRPDDITRMSYSPRLDVEDRVTGHPAFQDKIYPIDIARKLNRAFGPEGNVNRALRGAAEISNFSKALMLTGDLAQYLQQGSALMFYNPKAWSLATLKSLQSIGDKNVTGRYLRNSENYQAASEFAQAGGSIGHLQDFAAGAAPGELATRIPYAGKIIKTSGRAFGTYFDIAKIELWKALREVTPKEEWGKMVEQIDNMVLSGKMEAAGLSPGRAATERAALMAPSYYRGALQLVAGLVGTDRSARETQKMLFRYVGGLTTLMVGSYLAAGMSKDEILKRLTPGTDNRKFLAFPLKIGNTTQEIGPGGLLLQLISLAKDTATGGKDLMKWGTQNPLIRFLASKLGPVPGMASEVMTGRDTIGRPVRPLEALTKRALPVSASGLVNRVARISEGGKQNLASDAVGAAANFVGVKSRVSSKLSEVQDLAKKFVEDNNLKKDTGWELSQVDEPSYSKLRAAASAERQGEFNKAYDDLLKTHKPEEIRKGMEAWLNRGFTGSKRNEEKFKQWMSRDDFRAYMDAKQEKRDIYDNFRVMKMRR